MSVTGTSGSCGDDEGGSRRPGGAGVVIAVTIPLVLLGNALLVLLVPWHADLQYAVPGFPGPPSGITEAERPALARDGIVSIWPVGPGESVLEEARLESGRNAFEADEVSHMADVRAVVRAALIVWLVSVIILIAMLVTGPRQRLAGAVRAGALATLASFVVIGLISVLSFDQLFTSFHEVLFEDGTWTFPLDSTLIGLYPERFWVTATGALVGLAALQAVALLWWSGRAGRSGPDRSTMPG